MGGYVANFTVYTMAMIGLICFAIFVYKKLTDGTMSKSKTQFLSIEDSMSLSPRKTLHVVRAGNEKFLIASDVERTTLISKLGCSGSVSEQPTTIQTKDLDRFRNIELENQLPQNDFQNDFQNEIQKAAQQVHLELISGQNPKAQNLRRGMDRKISSNIEQKHSVRNQKVQRHNTSTMRDMAMKINEL